MGNEKCILVELFSLVDELLGHSKHDVHARGQLILHSVEVIVCGLMLEDLFERVVTEVDGA